MGICFLFDKLNIAPHIKRKQVPINVKSKGPHPYVCNIGESAKIRLTPWLKYEYLFESFSIASIVIILAYGIIHYNFHDSLIY